MALERQVRAKVHIHIFQLCGVIRFDPFAVHHTVIYFSEFFISWIFRQKKLIAYIRIICKKTCIFFKEVYFLRYFEYLKYCEILLILFGDSRSGDSILIPFLLNNNTLKFEDLRIILHSSRGNATSSRRRKRRNGSNRSSGRNFLLVKPSKMYWRTARSCAIWWINSLLDP